MWGPAALLTPLSSLGRALTALLPHQHPFSTVLKAERSCFQGTAMFKVREPGFQPQAFLGNIALMKHSALMGRKEAGLLIKGYLEFFLALKTE